MALLCILYTLHCVLYFSALNNLSSQDQTVLTLLTSYYTLSLILMLTLPIIIINQIPISYTLSMVQYFSLGVSKYY